MQGNQPFHEISKYWLGGGIVITIFKSKNDIPQDVEYVELNDIYFNQNTARKLDDRAQKVIEIIDEAKLISKYKICSKFNNIVLDVDKLLAQTEIHIIYRIFVKNETYHASMILPEFPAMYQRFIHPITRILPL